MKKMISVENISKRFGNKVALEDISFSIAEGQIFGFLGPSGSGKTTTISILTNQLKADSGRSMIMGKNSRQLDSDDFTQLGLVGDSSGFYEKMTLYDNLYFYSQFYGVDKTYLDEMLKRVGLYDSCKTIAEKLSTGMKQRMFLVRALINQPKILFLDEPTSGLDPSTSHIIYDLILDLKAKGTTIFLTTHDMHEATLLCDNLVLIHNGKIVEEGNPHDLIIKHNHDKKVTVFMDNGEEMTIAFEELKTLVDYDHVQRIHSCEPSLEDIFMSLTGGKLNV